MERKINPLEKELKRGSKAHTTYRQKAGNIVPGITSVTGMTVDTWVLTGWANSLGLEGVDSRKYTDHLAEVGNVLHYYIECYFKKQEPILRGFTEVQIELGRHCYDKFLEWVRHQTIEIWGVEVQQVSEKYPFGGTGDFFGVVNGEPTYIDFKTSPRTYLEHKVQCVANKELWNENNPDRLIEKCMIGRAGRNLFEGFGFEYVYEHDEYFALFLDCLSAWHRKKKLS